MRTATGGPERTRAVWFDRGFLPARIVAADALGAGDRLDGPAVVQAPTSTILVGPGDVLRVEDDATFLLDVGA